jgi:hypothetical protein
LPLLFSVLCLIHADYLELYIWFGWKVNGIWLASIVTARSIRVPCALNPAKAITLRKPPHSAVSKRDYPGSMLIYVANQL